MSVRIGDRVTVADIESPWFRRVGTVHQVDLDDGEINARSRIIVRLDADHRPTGESTVIFYAGQLEHVPAKRRVVGRDRETGAGLLLWIAERVIEGRAAVTALTPRRGTSVDFAIDFNSDMAIEVEEALASSAEDSRSLSMASLALRHTNAERMALKWSAAFEDLTRTVTMSAYSNEAGENPYTKSRARMIELAKLSLKGGPPFEYGGELAALVIELFGERR